MLPPPRRPGRYAVELVCLGNICRSPTAHVVLERLLEEADLSDRVSVHSSGTGDWHVGGPMDRRAAAALAEAGYDPTRHRARQLDPATTASRDLVLAMDLANLAALGGRSERVGLFRDFDPLAPGAEVPDPYGAGGAAFAEVLVIVGRTARELVARLRDLPGLRPRDVPPGAFGG